MDLQTKFLIHFYDTKDDGISAFGLIFSDSPQKNCQKIKKYTRN